MFGMTSKQARATLKTAHFHSFSRNWLCRLYFAENIAFQNAEPFKKAIF